MDEATMQSILQRKGGADNPENRNRIIQFAGANPNVLEHYGAGMSGSTPDDNSALLQLIAKQMDTTNGVPPPQALAPEPLPTVQAASAPTRRNATAGPSPGDPTRGSPTGTGAVNPLDVAPGTPNRGGAPRPTSGYEVDPQQSAAQPSSNWLLPMLASLLGVTKAANVAPPAPKMKALPRSINEDGTPALPNDRAGQKLIEAPPKQLTGPDPEPKQLTDQRTPGQKQDPAEVERMKAEVAAENAAALEAENAAARQLQEQMRMKSAQTETFKTLKAAKRALTGR